jgi:hypothetical protein
VERSKIVKCRPTANKTYPWYIIVNKNKVVLCCVKEIRYDRLSVLIGSGYCTATTAAGAVCSEGNMTGAAISYYGQLSAHAATELV